MSDTASNNMISSLPPTTIFTKCCLCFPLKARCFIFEYLNLILSVLHIVTLISFTTYLANKTHGFDRFEKEMIQMPNMTLVEITEPVTNNIVFMLFITMLSSLIWLIVSIYCLIVFQETHPVRLSAYIGFVSTKLLLDSAWCIYIFTVCKTVMLIEFMSFADLGIGLIFIMSYFLFVFRPLGENEEDSVRGSESINSSEVMFFDPCELYTIKGECTLDI